MQRANQELQQALTALYPKHETPLSLSVVYLDTPDHGPVLTASVRLANEALSYEGVEGKHVEQEVGPVGVQEAGGEQAIPLPGASHDVGLHYPGFHELVIGPSVGGDANREDDENDDRTEKHGEKGIAQALAGAW